MTAAHTPTPWKQRENNPRNVASTLPDGGAHVVAVFASAGDAAFAVHAANCHDDMLAALKASEEFHNPNGAAMRRAVIAKAEGRPS